MDHLEISNQIVLDFFCHFLVPFMDLSLCWARQMRGWILLLHYRILYLKYFLRYCYRSLPELIGKSSNRAPSKMFPFTQHSASRLVIDTGVVEKNVCLFTCTEQESGSCCSIPGLHKELKAMNFMVVSGWAVHDQLICGPLAGFSLLGQCRGYGIFWNGKSDPWSV